MLICLWKGCENSVFEEAAAFQEHVNKHGQEQMQMPTLSNQKKNADRTREEEQPMAKKAKLTVDEGEGKMPYQVKNGRRKIVFLSIEVWVDVFGFIKRIQLARTVSLANRLIHQICWPRLHGNKVEAHWVREIVIGNMDEFDGRTPTALTLKNGTGMPLVSWPPPDYISGFHYIKIKFLDQQVLELLTHIFPRIAPNNVIISLCLLKELDEEQLAFVSQLMDILCRGFFTIHLHNINCSMVSILLLQDMNDKMEQQLELAVQTKLDIPILMQMLAKPRADGKQRAMKLTFCWDRNLARRLLYAIKKEFHASTKPLPPFYLRLSNVAFERIEEENQHETLLSFNDVERYHWDICRHPKGQHEQLAEDGRKRLQRQPFRKTTFVEIEF